MTRPSLLVLLVLLAACASSSSSSNTSDAANDSVGNDGCRSGSDCGGASFCANDNLPTLCGGVCDFNRTDSCTSDAECTEAGANLVCDLICRCQIGGAQPVKHCTKGCSSDADCGAGLSCNGLHRCIAASCLNPGDCHSDDFMCNGGFCAAKSCKSDSDCAHFCVNGGCAATLGTCEQAVP
jgi:hypothetical protein